MTLLAAGCSEQAGKGQGERSSTQQPASQRPAGDAAQIRAVVTKSFKTRDPADCARLTTQRFLEQITFERGISALTTCRENTKSSDPARSVAVSNLTIDGDAARVRAIPRGGDGAGQTATYALVRRLGNWKIDRMTALDIDRPVFDAATRRSMQREPDALTAQQAECVITKLRSVSDDALERGLIAGDRSVILRPTIGCVRELFEQGIREELRRPPGKISGTQADCVIAGLRDRITDRQLEDLAASNSGGAPPTALAETLRALVAECTSNSAVT